MRVCTVCEHQDEFENERDRASCGLSCSTCIYHIRLLLGVSNIADERLTLFFEAILLQREDSKYHPLPPFISKFRIEEWCTPEYATILRLNRKQNNRNATLMTK